MLHNYCNPRFIFEKIYINVYFYKLCDFYFSLFLLNIVILYKNKKNYAFFNDKIITFYVFIIYKIYTYL